MHLEAYLRGGDESDRLLEILGTSSNMRRGGDTDETSAADDGTADESTAADSTADDRTTGTSEAPETDPETPTEGTQ